VDHGSLGSSDVEELSQPSLAMARCLDSSPGFRDREFEPAGPGFRDRKSTFSVLVSGTGPSPGFRDRVLFFLAARFPIDTAVLLLAARAARATAMASSIVLILRQSCIGGSDWLLRPCANVTRKRFGFRCSELPPRPRSVTRMKPSAFFPDCRRHGIVVHAKSDEGLFRNWQPAIVMTAVPSELDLDPGDNAMCGKAQRSICRAFQHFDGARRPLAADAVLARRLHATFLDFAKAICRERTHERTSGVGSMGCGWAPQEGHAPNFSLNLCAAHPGL